MGRERERKERERDKERRGTEREKERKGVESTECKSLGYKETL